ncbi:MAG: PAS domain-containing sensor histidine kinase [Snowella sp.]|nr:PAS domain-containing sensor histidine kinase [Snowella sp.]
MMDFLALLVGIAIGFGIGAWERYRLKSRLKPLLTALPDTVDVANSLSLTSLVRREIFYLTEQCQQLEADLARWKLLLERSPISYLWVDGENHLLECNQAARDLLQIDRWQPGQLRLLLELVRSYELDQFIQQIRYQQSSQTKEWVFYPLPATEIDPQQNLATQSLMLRGYGYALPQQQVVVFLENLQPLVELSLQRDRAFSDLTHELRTPLTAISLVAETLHQRLQGTEKQWMEQMLQEIGRLTHLVESWLHLAQIKESPHQSLQYQAVELRELILSSWQRLKPLAEEKQVTLDFKGPDSIPLNADRDRLMQVFLNLFDNSLKHSPINSRIQVVVTALSAPEGVEIQISDQGKGFHPNDLPYVFDRLYRGDPSRTRQGFSERRQGSGLGLAIAKEIVEAHGGAITAQNNPDTGGACLTIYFPLTTK